MKKPPLIFIVILNYNGQYDTIECIKSIRKSSYKHYKIVIVDNGSKDESVSILKREFPDVKLIENEENSGFGGGNNTGIDYSLQRGVPYILLLNNDTVVEKDFLYHMIEAIEKDEKIGLVAPSIYYYNQPGRIWSAGGYISWIRGSGFHLYRSNKDRFVSFVSGCCMLIKVEVMKRVGLFSEDYFLYLEDADYCRRVADANFKIRYVARSTIYHKAHSTVGGKNSPSVLYYCYRNRLFFTKKYAPKLYYYIFLLYLTVTITVKFSIWGISGHKDRIKYVRLGIRDFLLNRMGKADI